MARIDVHIIAGEHEPWLEECLDSLQNEPVNLFIVDRVEGDTSKARTVGFSQGKAEYVSFVDPDDLVVPGIFDQCLNILDNNKTLSGVYTDEVLIDKHGNYIMDGWSINPEPFKQYGYRHDLHQGIHHLRVLRREAVEWCLPLQTKRMPEPVLMAQLQEFGPLHHLNVIGYQWRIHGENVFLTYTEEEMEEAINLVHQSNNRIKYLYAGGGGRHSGGRVPHAGAEKHNS